MVRWRERGKTTAEQLEPTVRRLRSALELGAAQFGCRHTANPYTNLRKLWLAL